MISENGEKIIKYVERCSKNKTIGLKNSRMEPKVTYIYENEENPKRCEVRLHEEYIKHIGLKATVSVARQIFI